MPVVQPQTIGVSPEKLSQIDGLIERAIADKKMPGAVVLVSHRGKIVYRKAFGNRSLAPKIEKMTVDTVFDLASLTKVVATTTSIMQLVERGEIRLTDTIGDFFPEMEDKEVRKVTVRQLLTHTGGFRPDFDLREKWTGRDGMLRALKNEKLRNQPGTRFVYSDIGFIVLGEIVERVSETNLPHFFSGETSSPLGMKSSGFFEKLTISDKDLGWVFSGATFSNFGNRTQYSIDLTRIAPTENIKGQQSYLGSVFEGDDGEKILRGQVHDPTAFRMNGVAGHAGLFSTADDLALFCQMLLNGGQLDGKRILSAGTVALMTTPNVVSEDGATRGLGWDLNTSFSSNRGELFPLGSFGHTGFTGTGIWIDPASQTFVIFLSNRVHPDGKGDITDVRAKVSTVVGSAIEDLPIEKLRQAEANYFAAVNPQIEKFKTGLSQKTVRAENRNSAFQSVLNGIDVLEKNGFRELNGLKIGLVTNQTGRDFNGKSSIDVLFEAKNLKLTALFSPEHGIRGELDQSRISDSVDEKTGLPIYSLYGETRRPKPEQLRDLDAIVFDIQDIGTRFYTYISTLLYLLEEARKAGKPVFVLDRPNPINGLDVEGPIADSDKLSFVAPYPLPVRHGMTVGELALLFNRQNKIDADLKIIKMENWERGFWFDQTGQIWTNPSPNMRSLTEAALYPGIGLLETTNLSVGRGTDTPFEVIGAPWLDGQQLAAFLNRKNLPGVKFVPVRFTPDASVYKNQSVNGINILITDRAAFKPVSCGIEIAAALQTLFPKDWKTENLNRLLANQETFEKIKLGFAPSEMEKDWGGSLEIFKKIREQFLLYK
ncbi:MAG: DUF1343 domain-containing protein [Pyrinomonadaceae bacterium]